MDEHFAKFGERCVVQPRSTVGLRYRDGCEPVVVGNDVTIRTGTVIYADVRLGDWVQTGHNVLIRENTVIGNHVSMGTNVVLEGDMVIGDFVKFAACCVLGSGATIGSRVFFGPHVTLTNDPNPLKDRDSYQPQGPVIGDNVTLGTHVVVLPGIRIGEGSFVAAGTVVTRDVEPFTFVKGTPGRPHELPEALRGPNTALSWRKYLGE